MLDGLVFGDIDKRILDTSIWKIEVRLFDFKLIIIGLIAFGMKSVGLWGITFKRTERKRTSRIGHSNAWIFPRE